MENINRKIVGIIKETNLNGMKRLLINPNNTTLNVKFYVYQELKLEFQIFVTIRNVINFDMYDGKYNR